MIGVLVAGCGFGWLGMKVRKARQQQAAVAAIDSFGGLVRYDYEFDSRRSPVDDAAIPGPAWLRALLGDDLFRSVYSVHLPGRSVTDAELECLKGFTSLKRLDLTAAQQDDTTQVSDAGLDCLSHLTQLEELYLTFTAFTDTALEHLKGLTKLRRLSLFGTKVTDTGLGHLTGLPNLVELWLSDTRVTDAGLQHLKGLPQLERLWLDNTQVSDAGVAKLQQALPKCEIRR